ncbi:MAG: polyprenol monophosphomannose synthase [Candidatus Omnitrophota bacterium]|jgi:dolichol-phosphate mannosyltransferase
MKPILLIPTYDEKENITDLIPAIRGETAECPVEILVIDSGSPDGTGEAVSGISRRDNGVHLLQQNAKLGLGRAYVDGMQWALARDYDVIITMDADFSHHPRYIPELLRRIKDCDLVIGSRYIPGGELRDWPRSRRLLSRFANAYAKKITGLPFSDLTAGFQCFRSDLLRKVIRYPLHADGYAFLISLKFWSVVQEARFAEIPIIFTDRTKGTTKISHRVIFESIVFVWKCFFQRHRFSKRPKPVNGKPDERG